MYQPLNIGTAHTAIAMPARAGETLIVEGEPCTEILEIRRGVARAVSLSREGDCQVMAFFFPGDLLGLPLVGEHRYSAEAASDLHYVRHSPDGWRDRLPLPGAEDKRHLSAIWREEQAFMARGLVLGRVGALARMSAFLLAMVDRLPRNGGMVEFLVPQTDIASYLATTPETVCRSLRKLRELHLIAMPRKDQIALIAPERLALLAEGAEPCLRATSRLTA